MSILPHEKQILEYEATLRKLREGKTRLISAHEWKKLEKKLERLKGKVYSHLTPIERLAICRHAERPRTTDYLRLICDDFFELHGDRSYRDDRSILGGLAQIGPHRCMVIGQEKGHDTASRLHHNFGMSHPEGFRKALRLMELAAKFSLPICTLIDTPGAYPGLAAEERGQAWAIAENLRAMSLCPTPIVTVVIGEASSGGALAIALGDRVGMLEHGYYSVISPEGCASILWKDASRKEEAASALKLNAENLFEFEVVDEVIGEPLGGAHHDPEAACQDVKNFLVKSFSELKEGLSQTSTEALLQQRYDRYRKLGRTA